MPAPDQSTRPARRTAPAARPPVEDKPYQLPTLGEVTHIATAKRTYELGTYTGVRFVAAADAREIAKQAKQAGVDPFSLSLLRSDLLVLTKSDGTTRIIPVTAILEMQTKSA